MVWNYIVGRWDQIWFGSLQHFSLVVQSLILATVVAMLIAFLVYCGPKFSSVANGVSAVGLTIPSFALIGIVIVPFGFGVTPSMLIIVAACSCC